LQLFGYQQDTEAHEKEVLLRIFLTTNRGIKAQKRMMDSDPD
jgi:hypothetical protein